MKNFIILFVLIVVNIPSNLSSQTVISIGMNTNQPPYSFEDETGLALDIINEINKMQSDFIFEISYLPPERAKQYLNNGKIDSLAMTNINWGYDANVCNATDNLIKVEDKYFSRKDVATNQNFFSGVGKKSTIVVNGFNYMFLDHEKDSIILQDKFNTIQVKDEPTVIKMILGKRGDIGVSSSTTLGYFSITNPDEYEQLLISEINDSEYYRYFLIRNDSKISVEQFNKYIAVLGNKGVIDKLFKKYGLK